MHFAISDNGVGSNNPVINADSGNFGHRLISSLADRLNAAIETENEGGYKVQVHIRDYKLRA